MTGKLFRDLCASRGIRLLNVEYRHRLFLGRLAFSGFVGWGFGRVRCDDGRMREKGVSVRWLNQRPDRVQIMTFNRSGLTVLAGSIPVPEESRR